MPVESQLFPLTLTPMGSFWWIVKAGVVILSLFGFAFSLITLRQVNLMTDTLITENAGLLRAFAIIFAGTCLGLTILFIGLLF